MADIARVTSNNLVLIRKNNSNPFEKYMPYIEIARGLGILMERIPILKLQQRFLITSK